MYKSPIEIFQTEIEMQMEGEILRAVQRVGVSVDKEELLKTLKYDRDQYSKGYEDAKKESRWIPVSERLPEEYDSIFAKFKGTDKWSNVMFEKKSDEVNVTVEFEDGTRKTGTSYILDGGWRCEKENRFAKQKVVAWQPIPEPYNGE